MVEIAFPLNQRSLGVVVADGLYLCTVQSKGGGGGVTVRVNVRVVQLDELYWCLRSRNSFFHSISAVLAWL